MSEQLWRDDTNKPGFPRATFVDGNEYRRVVPVTPEDVMDAAHKLVHPMYDHAADCDKFWCEPFRALTVEVDDE